MFFSQVSLGLKHSAAASILQETRIHKDRITSIE